MVGEYINDLVRDHEAYATITRRVAAIEFCQQLAAGRKATGARSSARPSPGLAASSPGAARSRRPLRASPRCAPSSSPCRSSTIAAAGEQVGGVDGPVVVGFDAED